MRGLWFRPRSDSGSWGGKTPFFAVKSVLNHLLAEEPKKQRVWERQRSSAIAFCGAEGVNLENLLQFLSFEVSICCVV